MIKLTVLKNEEFSDSIWRERAKAIIPLIRPVYQKSFLSFFERGKDLLIILKKRGKTDTLRNLIRGIKHIKNSDIAKAVQLRLIYKREAPRNANIKAWKRYLID